MPGPEVCKSAAACRAAPAPQPSIYGAPSSATFNGQGNVSPSVVGKPVVKSLTRAEKLTRVLKGCGKDKARKKRAVCERATRKRYGPVKPEGKTGS